VPKKPVRSKTRSKRPQPKRSRPKPIILSDDAVRTIAEECLKKIQALLDLETNEDTRIRFNNEQLEVIYAHGAQMSYISNEREHGAERMDRHLTNLVNSALLIHDRQREFDTAIASDRELETELLALRNVLVQVRELSFDAYYQRENVDHSQTWHPVHGWKVYVHGRTTLTFENNGFDTKRAALAAAFKTEFADLDKMVKRIEAISPDRMSLLKNEPATAVSF